MIPLVMSVIAKTETFQRDMARAGTQVGKFGTRVKSTSTIVTGLSRQLLTMAGVGGGLYALKSGLTSSVKTFAEFEKGIANVGTLLDEQSMRLIPQYEHQIRRMSMEFGEGTEILSKGLYDIISASIAPTKALKVLDVAVKAAKAGMSDTATAADALTTILNSYGYEAEKASRISDIMFTTIRRGKTTFAELAPNIGKVTSLAATAGLNFEELSAAIATMTRAGVQTEIAITSLRALILSFLKPQQDSIEAAKKFDLVLSSNTLKAEGLTGVIKKLENATAEELATIIPTSRAIAGFAAAIRNASGNAEDYNAIVNSLGATQDAYNITAATTIMQLEKANQAFLDLKRTIGEELSPAIVAGSKGLSWYVKNMLPLVWISKGLAIRDLKKQLEELQEIQFKQPELMGVMPKLETESLNERLEDVYGTKEKIKDKAAEDAAKKAKEAAYDEAQAYARMYDAINSKSKESYEWRAKLINMEYDLYREKTTDVILLEELRAERIRQLTIEQDKASEDFFLGFGAGIREMQQELQTLGEVGAEVALTLRDGFVDALDQAIWKSQDLEESLKNLGISIAHIITKWLLMQAVTKTLSTIGGALGFDTSGLTMAGTQVSQSISTAITTSGNQSAQAMSTAIISAGQTAAAAMAAAISSSSSSSAASSAIGSAVGSGASSAAAPSAHTAGTIGSTAFKLRALPASYFTNAPRLHDGLAADEFPAILQKGETVSRGPKGSPLERKLDTLISIMSQRQTINANIIDKRDIVTKERIESREGEEWTINHMRRNNG